VHRFAQQLCRVVAAIDATGDEHDGVIGPGAGGLGEDLREDDHLGAPLQILEGRHQHGRAGARDHSARRLDDAAQRDLGLVALLGQVAGVGGHVVGQLVGDVAQRMLREVQPQQLLLPAQPLLARHLILGDCGARELRCEGDEGSRKEVEEGPLPRRHVALVARAGIERQVDPVQQRPQPTRARPSHRP